MNLPEEVGGAAHGAVRSSIDRQSRLIAAYRQGLGLAAVLVARSDAGIRIVAAASGDDGALAAAGASVAHRWWTRRLRDAERVAVAATKRWRRRRVRRCAAAVKPDAAARSSARDDGSAVFCAVEATAGAATTLSVALQTDEEIFAEAAAVIARVDAEIDKFQRAGGMKSINKSYRSYRIDAAARGERVIRYADWMEKYREKLVRELATALRHI